MESPLLRLLSEQLTLVAGASDAFALSGARAEAVLRRVRDSGLEATVSEKETLEALTSRFTRLADILFQRVFRTLDQIELIDEGTNIDRLNRMEKRGLISSAEDWRALLATTDRIINYSKNKWYLA